MGCTNHCVGALSAAVDSTKCVIKQSSAAVRAIIYAPAYLSTSALRTLSWPRLHWTMSGRHHYGEPESEDEDPLFQSQALAARARPRVSYGPGQ